MRDGQAGAETEPCHGRQEALQVLGLEAGYRRYVGIEYEGEGLSEPGGIRATKALLERVREAVEPDYS